MIASYATEALALAAAANQGLVAGSYELFFNRALGATPWQLISGADYHAPSYTPQVCDAGWLIFYLSQQGLLASVQAYVAAGPAVEQLLFSRASSFSSNNPMILAWAQSLSPAWSQAQIDQFFISAIVAKNAANG